MKKAMVAGHICLDVTPIFTSPKVNNLDEVLSPGKLVHVGEADIHTGGAVANTGLALKIMGIEASLFGKVGKDSFGKVVKEILSKYGCGDSLVEDEAHGTSYSVVLAVPGVDRVFLHHPGANDYFYAQDLQDSMLEGISHFHFGYPPLMHSMFERDGEELYNLFARVKEKGITTSLDMASVDPNADSGKANWEKILKKVLPLVDFFVPSIEETCYMLDKARYADWKRRANGGDITRVLSPEQDIKPLADELLALGAKALLIKCGAPGMYYKTSSATVMSSLCKAQGLAPADWCDQEGFEKSYRQDTILSATGAGDTSIAAFLASMLKGYKLAQCVQLAAATGACCISTYDALSGLLPLETLLQKIDAGWEKENF